MLADIGWGGILSSDAFYAVLAIHPTDPAIFFTASSTGDLARFDGNAGTWRTGYDLRGLHKAAYPGRGEPGRLSVALDPQDANVGYVGIESYRLPRHLADREHPGGEPGLGGHHRELPPDQHRSEAGGAPADRRRVRRHRRRRPVRVLPAPGKRSHPSLIGNWTTL